MPSIIVIAGPNGAGKTTFANEYLSAEENVEFVNADEIARSLTHKPVGLSDIRSARLMLDRVNELVGTRADFAIETALAGLSYAPQDSALAAAWL